ncbi:hypothetical protein [Clostridium mediterraneense]|uniref:hypothetical protein n=1 Tax=Clostridium mediterraneense TaxID=1805472 RepID=UPI001A9A3249|nr:hypothetical protein [Clostridium mediterraneense]
MYNLIRIDSLNIMVFLILIGGDKVNKKSLSETSIITKYILPAITNLGWNKE